MGRRGHHRLTLPGRASWQFAPAATLVAGGVTFTGQTLTNALTSAMEAGALVFTGQGVYTIPTLLTAGGIVITGQPITNASATLVSPGDLTFTGQTLIAGALVASLGAGSFTFTGQWMEPVLRGYKFLRPGLIVVTGKKLVSAYHPHWRLDQEPMTYEAQLIRGRVSPGESVMWRVFMDRSPAEAAAYVPITAIAPADIATRKYTVEVSGDVTMGNHRHNTVYEGDLSETVYFGPGGGAVQFTFEDWPQRYLTDVALDITTQIDTKVLTVNPVIGVDQFDRNSAMSGELILQALRQAENDDEENYMEDLINKGWNLPKMFKMLEVLDDRVLRLERPEV